MRNVFRIIDLTSLLSKIIFAPVIAAQARSDRGIEKCHAPLKKIPELTRRVFESTEKLIIRLTEECMKLDKVFWILEGAQTTQMHVKLH